MIMPTKAGDLDGFKLCALECALMAEVSGSAGPWRLAAAALDAAILAELQHIQPDGTGGDTSGQPSPLHLPTSGANR